MRTDGQTNIAKLIFAFRNFAKTSNKHIPNFHPYTSFFSDLQLWSDGIQRYFPYVVTEI